MSWMKYELWGLVLVVIGALVAAGTAGVDTGNIGLSLDDIFAYAFGTGRIAVHREKKGPAFYAKLAHGSCRFRVIAQPVACYLYQSR